MPLADETALGLLETHGLVAGIEAADAMLKTAEVRLVALERTVPALITIKIVGETAAVQASVDAGRAAAERVGRVMSAHVIARPSDEVRAMMGLNEGAKPGRSGLFSQSWTQVHPIAGRIRAPEGKAPSTPAQEAGPPAATSRRTSAGADADDLDDLTVPELRAMARELPEFPIQGRDVARARKSQLIAALRGYRSS